MKKRDKEILFQLLRNSKLSDREIAKKLNTSQSTITRTRHKLERSGIIKYYTAMPEFKKVGVGLMAFTYGKTTKPSGIVLKKVLKFVENNPNVVFAGTGEGIGMTGTMLSLHSNFSDYADFIRKFREAIEGDIQDLTSFILPTDRIDIPFRFDKAIEHIIKKKES